MILARGLGLLRLVTNLLHSYDAAGNNLVLVVGADDRENGWIGEYLAEHAAISQSARARGLIVVNTDLMDVPEREKMYKQGGIFSITSRILVVDLLTGLMDPETVTGVIVLHADRVAATSLEAFILRIYRQKNRTGFLKAFSDNPEPFTHGWSPLTNMVRNLFLRRVSLWPRFHVSVAKSLEGRKRAEVIELEVPMTEMMTDIQNAVLECVETSIHELKKINTGLDMGDWDLDSALMKNFDVMIRRQLDPNWHRVSWKTKQIVADLTVLRGMLDSVLSSDAVSFLKHLDAIHAAHSPAPGSTRQSQSPWLFLDAAQTIFGTAKRRVYERRANRVVGKTSEGEDILCSVRPVLEEQPKWAVLAEVLEEIDRDLYFEPTLRDDSNGTILIMCQDTATCRQLSDYLQTMLVKPHEMESEAISEDEQQLGREEAGRNKENEENEDEDDPDQPSAKFMMRKRLRDYLRWKRSFANVNSVLFADAANSVRGAVDPRTNLAAGSKARPPPNKRRRVRGGGSAAAGPGRAENGSIAQYMEKPDEIAAMLAGVEMTAAEAKAPLLDLIPFANEALGDGGSGDEYFHAYDMSDLVIIHAYEGDQDEHVLEETRPKYVIMYEPDAAFIRRVEVYRSSHSDRNVRVYFLYYGGSVEEQRYLAAVRREKDCFTRLIKERASMSITLEHHHHRRHHLPDAKNRATTGDGAGGAGRGEDDDVQESFLRTINTRIAGGGKLGSSSNNTSTATRQTPRVVVDVREFRSTLPSLIHANGMVVVPCMLTVGDYVLSPNMVVERKSISDLVSSFKDGRLYAQCEAMFAHYQEAMLLIEFDENKSFTLEPFADYSASSASALSANALPSAKALSAPPADASPALNVNLDLQSKLVLLTLAFPRLAIIWSSSPYQSASVFQSLKTLQDEPDPLAAVRAGSASASTTPEYSTHQLLSQDAHDMLSAVPGINGGGENMWILARRCENIKEVANLSEHELEEMLGARGPARQIVEFFERDICA